MKQIMLYLLIVVGISLALIIVFVPIHFSAKFIEKGRTGDNMLIIAHRGASGVAPENTIPAIDAALTANADFIEIDVHLSKDNKIVVMHDFSVDRTTNGNGEIAKLDSSYIKSLDAGSFFNPEFAGTKVPFLEDVMERINGKAKLLIEIKEKRSVNTAIEKEVVNMIKKYNAEKWCVVQSFNDESLEEVHQLDPGLQLHKLIFFKFRFIPYTFDGSINYFSFNKYSYVSSFNMHLKLSQKSFLKKIHSKNKLAIAWGCSQKGACAKDEMTSWDGIITNYPDDYSE